MSDPRESPFVVQQLRPQRLGGTAGVYQLTQASTHPTAIGGRDANGLPIEETVPTTHWGNFVMPDGCVNKVPLRTGSVFSMDVDAQKYEQETLHDLITNGAIPLALCPNSTEWTHLTKGPFAKIGDGRDCGGRPNATGKIGATPADGCEHMQKLCETRKTHVLEKHRAEVRRIESMRDEERKHEAAMLRDGIVEGVGQVMAQHLAQKQRLRDGKSSGE